jgi:pimeloyl-ACP methyl ester carboxylesterase
MHLSKESVTRLRDFGTRPSKSYASREELVKRYRLEPPGSQAAGPDILRHVAMMSGREQPDGTWVHKFDRSLYAIFERLDGMPYWNHVRVPALLVKGGRSDRLEPGTLERIRAHAPHVQFVEVPDADHHVMLDNPRGFVDAVRPFVT